MSTAHRSARGDDRYAVEWFRGARTHGGVNEEAWLRVTAKRKKRVDYIGLRCARLCFGVARGGRVLPGFAEVGSLVGDVTTWRGKIGRWWPVAMHNAR